MFNILLTKKLSQEHLDLIKSWEWNYEIVETLNISPIEVKEIPLDADAWIVSSRNSFAAVKKFINEPPNAIYCVGDWTKKEIEKLNTTGKIKSFENMRSLVADLASQNFRSVVCFCGDEHRQELEAGLKNTDTKISKVITHKFSPRSAESLLKNNQFSKQTVFSCIGSTTADYLRSRGGANIFVSSYPDSKILIEEFNQAKSRLAT